MKIKDIDSLHPIYFMLSVGIPGILPFIIFILMNSEFNSDKELIANYLILSFILAVLLLIVIPNIFYIKWKFKPYIIIPFILKYKYKKLKTLTERIDFIEENIENIGTVMWYFILSEDIKRNEFNNNFFKAYFSNMPFLELIVNYTEDEKYLNYTTKIIDQFNLLKDDKIREIISQTSYLPNSFLLRYKNILNWKLVLQNNNFKNIDSLILFKDKFIESRKFYEPYLIKNKNTKRSIIIQFLSMLDLTE
jgi:hypothetical protein